MASDVYRNTIVPAPEGKPDPYPLEQQKFYAMNPGEGTRLEQLVAARIHLTLRQLTMAYVGNSLTPERAYAGIAAIAALQALTSDLVRPALKTKE